MKFHSLTEGKTKAYRNFVQNNATTRTINKSLNGLAEVFGERVVSQKEL